MSLVSGDNLGLITCVNVIGMQQNTTVIGSI